MMQERPPSTTRTALPPRATDLRLRETDWFIFLFPDARANLTASVGIAEPLAICEPGPVTIPPQDLQFLFSPTGR